MTEFFNTAGESPCLNIVADSSCDLCASDVACNAVGFATVPFFLNIGTQTYEDHEQLNTLEMITAMEQCNAASTSACPAPDAWMQQFEKASQSIAITISSNLSGSYNSAMAARRLVLAKHPEKQIAVLDSRSTGPESALCIRKMAEWIKNGTAMDEVVQKAQRFLQDTRTSFALSSFDNLVKNGRMSRLTGFVARKLGMWGIGIASNEGTITMKGKSRGAEKALRLLVEDMEERGFSGDLVAVSHCHNPDMAHRLKNAIEQRWNQAKVSIMTTRGLDSFYAERGGLIIAFC